MTVSIYIGKRKAEHVSSFKYISRDMKGKNKMKVKTAIMKKAFMEKNLLN